MLTTKSASPILFLIASRSPLRVPKTVSAVAVVGAKPKLACPAVIN